MNMRMAAVCVMAGLAAGSAGAAPKAFEGVVSMTMHHEDQDTPMTWKLKGAKSRMEMAGPHGSMAMIFDATRHVMIMLMPERQMYMEMPQPRPQAPAAAKGKAGRVAKTGKTEKILGYLCEEYRSADDQGSTEVWAAKGLGTFAGMGGRPGAPRQAWEDEMTRGGFFPLRMVHRDAAGTETARMTATAIEPTALADDLFVPPAGYTKFEMPSGMGAPGAPRP